MNKYYYLLLMLMFLGCKSTETNEDSSKEFRMQIVKQGIKSVNSYEYLYKFGKVDSSTRFLKETVEFDKNGNAVKVLTYTRKDSLEHPIDSIVNVFDSNGDLIKSIETKHWLSIDLDKPFTTEVTTLEYKNENGKRMELIHIKNNKLTGRTIYKYNSDGKVSEYLSYDGNGILEGKAVYSYSNGKESGTIFYDKDGKQESRKEIIQKDKTHSLHNSYNEKDSLDATSEFVYNEKGWVLEHTYKRDNYFFKAVNTYNNWGLGTTIIKYSQLGEPETLTKIETR